MGQHQIIDKGFPAPKAFVWPTLPTLDQKDGLKAEFVDRLTGLSFDLQGKRFSIQPADARFCVGNKIDIRLACGAERLFIATSEDLIAAVLTELGYEQSFLDLTIEHAALVIEHLFAPVFAVIEEKLGDTLQVIGVGSVDGVPEGCALSMILPDDNALNFILGTSEAVLESLIPLLPPMAQKPEAVLDDAVFTARLVSCDCEMTKADFDALGIGDAILLDRKWAQRHHAQIVIHDTLSAPTEAGAGGRRLGRPLQPIKTDTATEIKMTAQPTDPIESLPVTVSVEIDNKEMSLADIRQLRRGSVLPFSAELPETVRLLAHGTVVASGKLVQLDDAVAVQITEMA